MNCLAVRSYSRRVLSILKSASMLADATSELPSVLKTAVLVYRNWLLSSVAFKVKEE
jgi:hypothetical protein